MACESYVVNNIFNATSILFSRYIADHNKGDLKGTLRDYDQTISHKVDVEKDDKYQRSRDIMDPDINYADEIERR